MLKVILKRFSEYDSNVGWSDIIQRITFVKVPTYNEILSDGRELEVHFDLDSAELSLSTLLLIQNIIRQINYCFINKFTLI